MIGRTLFLLAELVALFFAVSFSIRLLQRRIGPDRLRSWIGGRPAVAALKGIAIGFVTPFCTYSAIPKLIGMRQAKVAPAGYVAFIVAAPVLDPILFGALAIIVGLDVAIIYTGVTFVAAFSLAMLAERSHIERYLKPLPDEVPLAVGGRAPVVGESSSGGVADSEPAPCAGDVEGEWSGLVSELLGAVRSSVNLLRTVWMLMVIGVGIGVAIELLVPAESAAGITGSGSIFSIPIAAAMGVPLYFHTELFIPIAASLEGAGVGVGTIVALTIAGAGANVPEFVLLSRLARYRLIACLFGYVFTIAVFGGMFAQVVAG